jgi:hypothetical protein
MAATVFHVSRLNLNGVFMQDCTLRLGWFQVSAIVIEDIHVGFSCVGESVHYTGLMFYMQLTGCDNCFYSSVVNDPTE